MQQTETVQVKEFIVAERNYAGDLQRALINTVREGDLVVHEIVSCIHKLSVEDVIAAIPAKTHMGNKFMTLLPWIRRTGLSMTFLHICRHIKEKEFLKKMDDLTGYYTKHSVE